MAGQTLEPASRSGVNPLRLPLIPTVVVDPVFLVFALFRLATLLAFFALLAAIAHDRLLFPV
jgi:hypothetical protein